MKREMRSMRDWIPIKCKEKTRHAIQCMNGDLFIQSFSPHSLTYIQQKPQWINIFQSSRRIIEINLRTGRDEREHGETKNESSS